MIRVRLFGRFSELVENPDHLAVPADKIRTVADILAYFAADNPLLHREISAPQVLVAVNQQIVALGSSVADGDEVAFLPPVTGG